ncbi:biotin-dependent carboxyltransferase family protein [Cognaticolwellia beringensis]|uniref:Carboxyltransferase domain-containing protein n=1 Tax=Cognaticolwellia beringensis TaxID=1967665 RepID=A0A222G717_9GAMM|nr:biotin-dependent carboxyltransferase family protein [Cognaticolwellia beringensis]ASP47532.1 hypothetical protein B5D82_07055 [Cognaticolwellia beringensis]
MSQGYLEIISMNGQASIQDLGRLNAQHLGFSASGAADEFAFLSANKLINDKLAANDMSVELHNKQRHCATIEITLGQVSFEAKAACIISITGADCQAKINNVAVNHWQCYQLQAGDMLDFSMPKTGLHSYLAVLGGFTCQKAQQPWLGSYAQTINEMALGFTGEKLTVGSKLYFSAQTKGLTESASEKINKPKEANKPFKAPSQFYAQQNLTLRIMPSSLFLQMSSDQQQQFLSTEYIISPDSNRMGYRLSVSPAQILLTKSANEKILSEQLRSRCLLSMPVTYGMVQFPDNEQPIVLMKERQTMGGYPVLGTVMQTDLFRLSQMRPGEKVSFTLINHQQAQQQLIAFHQKFRP